MRIVNDAGRPVAGYVEFAYSRSGHRFSTQVVEIGRDGTLSVPTMGGLMPRFCVVKPVDGHWNWVVDRPTQHQTSVCLPVAVPDGATWWKAIVGRAASDPTAGVGIGIAVIDLGFQPHGTLAHVRVTDVEGDELDPDYLPPDSHGCRVCKVLGERGAGIERQGIAPGADLYLIDVSDEISVDDFDGEKLGAAIEVAVERYGVDLINVSAGAYIDGDDAAHGDVLRKSVAFARDRGALVIAATGNDGRMSPAIPARFAETIGVGAIGMCDVAPPGSFMRHYQNRAVTSGRDRGVLAPNDGVFHYIESCFGPGLDLVGPGIGISLGYDGARIEYVGTSYACPIVVGALACALSGDAVYRALGGIAKTRYAERLLKGMCHDMGMDPWRQGAGLPIWRRP